MRQDEVIGLLNPKHLNLILLPTEDCNFRCTYCYEDFATGRMAPWTIQAIKMLIDKRITRLHSFALSWFGGEPLIAKDIVADLTEYAQRASASVGVTFSSDMTTNGYTLNSTTFDSLLKLGIHSYQISLDGDEYEHDKTRKLFSGKGSFAKIWSNLISMRSSKEPFQILLRIHLHGTNFESVKKLLGEINKNFGADARFVIFLKAIGNWGGSGVKTMKLAKSSPHTIDELNVYLGEIGWYNSRKTGSGLSDIRACYAALPNSFVIRADGSLAKCTVAFNDPRNCVGKINEDGTLSIENQPMQSFMRGFQTLKESDLSCPIREMPAKEQAIRIQNIPRLAHATY